MKAITLALYRALLRLYPADFREMFGDEMLETYALAYGVQQSPGFCLRELYGLLWGLIREHGDGLVREASPVAQARLITRIASLLLALFYLLVSIDSRSTIAQVIALFSLLQVMAVGIAWRWERGGGLAIIGVGAATSAMMALTANQLFSVYPAITIFFALLRSLPFFLFGAMFAFLDQVEVRRAGA